MKNYVCIEEFEEWITKRLNSSNPDEQFGHDAVEILAQLHVTQPADVREIRHANWIYHECVASYDGTKSGYSCSECHAFVEEEIFESESFHNNYCGNCAAVMSIQNEMVTPSCTDYTEVFEWTE